MNLITRLRENKGFTKGFFAVMLVTFLIAPVSFLPQYLQLKQQGPIAVLGGKKIYPPTYGNRIERKTQFLMPLFYLNGLDQEQVRMYANMDVWNDLLFEHLPKGLYDDLGLAWVCDEEMQDLLFGKNRSNVVGYNLHFFRPNAARTEVHFSETALVEYLKQAQQTPQGQQAFAQEIGKPAQVGRKKEKLVQLINAATHTPADLQAPEADALPLQLSYLFIPLKALVVPHVTSQEIEDRYHKEFDHLYAPERVEVEYVRMDPAPSLQDRQAAEQELKQDLKSLQETKEPDREDWARSASAGVKKEEEVHIFLTKEQLPRALRLGKGSLRPADTYIEKEGDYYTGYLCVGKQKKRGKTYYEFYRIFRRVEPSEYTKEDTAKDAHRFAESAKGKKAWEQAKKERGYFSRTLTFTDEEVIAQKGSLTPISKIAQALYESNGKLKRAPVAVRLRQGEEETNLVVIVTHHQERGHPPLNKATKEVIRKKLEKEKMEHDLREKNLSWAQLSTEYSAKEQEFTLCNLSTTTLPHAGKCPRAIGSAVALPEGACTKVFAAEKGFVVIRVKKKRAKPPKGTKEEKEELATDLEEHQLLEYLQKKGPYQDNRHKY